MSNALRSVRFSAAAMVSAAAGWVSFAIALRLGDHFNTVLEFGLLIIWFGFEVSAVPG